MQLTDYHAKYFAHQLLNGGSDKMERLAGTMRDAQIELTPHQIEAALFAFRSPLSKGVILADEVGLCKTIEAGLVISQKLAEKSSTHSHESIHSQKTLSPLTLNIELTDLT